MNVLLSCVLGLFVLGGTPTDALQVSATAPSLVNEVKDDGRPRRLTVSGVVRRNGLPVEGASVTFTTDAGGAWTVTSDAHGAFHLDTTLPAKAQVLLATARDGAGRTGSTKAPLPQGGDVSLPSTPIDIA